MPVHLLVLYIPALDLQRIDRKTTPYLHNLFAPSVLSLPKRDVPDVMKGSQVMVHPGDANEML